MMHPRHSLLLVLILLAGSMVHASDDPITRMDPPHWWAGLGDGELQILVYGPDISAWEPSLEAYEGVSLHRVQRTENPNYLFLDLTVAADAASGDFILRFQQGIGRRQKAFAKTYSLRERSAWRPAGLDPSDLMYLIMPDRFANGDPGNDDVPGMQQRGVYRDSLYERHGGDLAGMQGKLDYLADFGVTAIWPTPLVENDQPFHSYHGYAVTDHYRIDPRFGSHADYLSFTAACHARGIKVVMDMVHNHIGDRHWWYRDLPSANWIHRWDSFTRTNYRAPILLDPHAAQADRDIMLNGWFDTHMPDLNQRDPLLARYLIQNNIWWVEEARIDAFRMDTWAYSDPDFLEQWSAAVAEAHPSLFVFGETWVHGGLVQAWFHGGTKLDKPFQPSLDALTDFQAYYGITETATRNPGWTEGVNRLYYTLAKDYVYEHPERNVVFLDNHDLSRFRAVVKEDPAAFRLGLDWLLTVRGIPMLYYGTEIGMAEYSDGHGGTVRRDFSGGWAADTLDKFSAGGRTPEENALFDYLRGMARWRANTPVLHTGKLTQFVPVEGMYAYARHDKDQAVLVLLNGTDKEQSTSLKRFSEITQGYRIGVHPVTGEQHALNGTLSLAPRASIVLVLRP